MGAGGPHIDLTDLEAFAAGPPHDQYVWLRDREPVFWHEPTSHTPGAEGFWCLTRHQDVAWAAKNPDLFSSEGGGDRDGGGTLIEDLPAGFAAGVLLNMADDPRHHHVRRLVTPSLSPRRLHALEATLAARCGVIVDEVLDRGRCDLLVDVAAELPLQAIASLLGVPQADRHRFLAWADTTLDYDDRNPGESSPRAAAAAAEMFAYSEQLLADKRVCPGDDLMSIVAEACLPPEADPGGPMTQLEQQMFFSLLAAAGSETTRNAIAGGVLAFVDQPDQWEAVRSDRSLLPAAVEEVLRWTSATIYNRRTATATIERRSQVIEPGDKVVLWWQAANFDERVFADPHRFDVRRTPNPHLAFGLGTHFCLGARLARVEITLMLGELLDRVATIEVTGPVERTRSNKHAGYRHVPVELTAR